MATESTEHTEKYQIIKSFIKLRGNRNGFFASEMSLLVINEKNLIVSKITGNILPARIAVRNRRAEFTLKIRILIFLIDNAEVVM